GAYGRRARGTVTCCGLGFNRAQHITVGVGEQPPQIVGSRVPELHDGAQTCGYDRPEDRNEFVNKSTVSPSANGCGCLARPLQMVLGSTRPWTYSTRGRLSLLLLAHKRLGPLCLSPPRVPCQLSDENRDNQTSGREQAASA
ncbi:unnamed protein product, partial [Ectocarpus sp. 12 AP-2014]